MTKIRAGVVGLGRLGSLHAENTVTKIQEVELIAACAADKSQLEFAKNNLNIENLFDSNEYEKMIDEMNLDAVIIVSPTPFHPEMIRYAINKGLHVFCEKPLGLDIEEVKDIVTLIESKKEQVFQIGYMRRYDNSYRYAKKMIDDNKLGDIVYIRGYGVDPVTGFENFRKFATNADSGGIFADVTIHDIDLIRWFTGQEPIETYSIGGLVAAPELKEIGEYDTGVSQYKMSGGTIATLLGGRYAIHGNQIEMEIMGTKGWIRVGEHPDLNRVTIFNENGVVKPSINSFEGVFGQAYLTEMQEFFEHIKNDTRPEVTAYDGLRSLIVAKASQKSAETGELVKIN